MEHLFVDDVAVELRTAEGTVRRIAWADVSEVSILTTDLGPSLCDVFFVLKGTDGKSLTIADELEGTDRLLQRLQRLRGFDNEALTQSMRSTDNASFLCWKKA